jgi:hypothetical protein
MREPFIDGAFERERRKEVLAHQRVLKLCGRAEHIDERAAMLDNDRALVHRLFTSQVEDVAQPALDRRHAGRRGPAWLGEYGFGDRIRSCFPHPRVHPPAEKIDSLRRPGTVARHGACAQLLEDRGRVGRHVRMRPQVEREAHRPPNQAHQENAGSRSD